MGGSAPTLRTAGEALNAPVASGLGRPGMSPSCEVADVAVVVPSRDEADNVAPLVARATETLQQLGLKWELVFVDDSDDATPDHVREAGRRHPGVRLLHRPPGARSGGLSGAVLSGFEATSGAVVAVMDADLQHPPELLPDLLGPVWRREADITVASRFVPSGGRMEGLDGQWRRFACQGSRSSTRVLFPRVRCVSDPLAGFFAFRRPVIDGVSLRPEGFKILLELLVRGSWNSVVEIPCVLEERQHGESKAGFGEFVAFGRHVARLVSKH